MGVKAGPYYPFGGKPSDTIVTPFAPSDVSNLQVWHKGDGTMWQDSGRTSLVTTNGQTVKAWDDFSGNARHATRSAATNTYSAATNAGGNNKPGVSCQATSAFLTSPYTIPSTFTIFVVWQSSITNGFGRAIDGNATNWMMGPRQASGQQTAYYAGNFSGYGPYTANQSEIQMVTQASSVGTQWVNGTVVAGTVSSPSAIGTFNMGAGASFGEALLGFIQEVLVYDKVLTTTERQNVERYLGASTRYNIVTP